MSCHVITVHAYAHTKHIKDTFLYSIAMKSNPKNERYKRVIESIVCDHGVVKYTEIARALNITPSYARALLETYCPGEFESGVCTADPDACPKKEKKEEVIPA